MENQAAQLYSGSGVTEFYTDSKEQRRSDNIENSLSSRAEDVLVAVAVLGLAASVADGEADFREVRGFTRSFQQEFVLTTREATRIIGVALKQLRSGTSDQVIDCPCETLNEYLNLSQKMRLFDGLAEVLVADGVVHKNEEHFLDYIAIRLNIVEALKDKFPQEEDRPIMEGVVRWS